MSAKRTQKAQAWGYFDRIVRDAAPAGLHSNPWAAGADGELVFVPDYATLERLLGVPLHLRAATTTGVPALALDVWISYELRRAGFNADAVWPRPSHPRVLPVTLAHLLAAAPASIRKPLDEWISSKASIKNVTSASATVLGKNYLKQVDVIMSDWQTGPELLISTKRMDSSYGKNAPNRVEESYGDAKNLRLRHPLAALGFVFGLRSDILQKEPKVAEWLLDLLVKLGREDDAYHSTCLVMIEYDDEVAVSEDDGSDPEDRTASAGLDSESEIEDIDEADAQELALDAVLSSLPKVSIRHDATPAELSPGRFLGTIVNRVLDATPVNLHLEARARKRLARISGGQ
ncbi:hypothetical protein ATK74_1241 [Propionicimonas paludicola]|uniref:Uncharacterized protein n=1 Tax=Propionicimonas paludicola TaxID=185243 RepID=A0A2A9CSS8_9ACTN|nr:hypothetical protein [Propionicimonas paludicola]PFG16690.1 hypothetical protein ATK74_1241 [Propionicimonas paludicola]